VGIGNDGPPLWDRFEIVKKDLLEAGFSSLELEKIEEEQKREMQDVWSTNLL
jgi:hypothetical protein